MLKATYYPDGEFLNAPLGTRPSQTWRTILDGRDVLMHGLIRRIGNGKSTLIWEDNWLPRDRLLRPVCQKTVLHLTKVLELIDHTNATWRRELLDQFLVETDKEKILNVPLSTMNQADIWPWHFDRSGIFSVRSAYRMLIKIKAQREDWLEGRANTSNIAAQDKLWKSF